MTRRGRRRGSYAFILYLLLPIMGYSQKKGAEYTQYITGKILDENTMAPIEGAYIQLSSPSGDGTTSDSLGYFKIKSPIGRQEIKLSHLNYYSQQKYILINSAREEHVMVYLSPKDRHKLEEVKITAPLHKETPQNKMVYASGRTFSVDEANKYAGTLGDPARMAQSYAGVNAAQDERNDIIIRGNSPIGVQWILDGYEIPNPNHYGGIGLTGNRVTLLNMNLMDNSDFLTGAFPSEYGNALSGVFDLSMRKGNQSHHQFWGQMGWNGFELGAEGPFSKKKEAGSYMLCYRYSFLDLLSKMGINTGIDPKYQDLTAKVSIPLSKKLDLSFLTLVGTSAFTRDDHTKKELKASRGQYLETSSDMAFQGMRFDYKASRHSKLQLNLSYLDNSIKTYSESFDRKTDIKQIEWDENSTQKKYAAALKYQYNSFSGNLFRAGIKWDSYDARLNQKGLDWNQDFNVITDANDWLHLLRIYAQDAYQITPSLSATLGMNLQYFLYNKSYSLEPRAALRLKLGAGNSLSFAYGQHAQMQPIPTYFTQSHTSPQKVEQKNKDLDFSRANHYVLSYDQQIGENIRFKAEAYYQHLYQIPVENASHSIFSIINTGAEDYIPAKGNLVNKGKGENYGIEITVEKFLHHNYYYMVTGSIFKSRYTAADGKWRNSAFDASYMLNGLMGYELWTSRTFAIGADMKISLAGGRPYIPVNETLSQEKNEVIHNYDQAYIPRYDNYFRSDLKLYYRQNLSNVYLEFAVDLQNLTNHKNIDYQRYEPETGSYITYYQKQFFPMYTFKILF